MKYIVEANIWRDKINGNTYHSVNITDVITNKLIFSSGITYGYGEQYRITAIKSLTDLKLWKKENWFNHEMIRKDIYFSVNENALKRDLKKIEVQE